MENIQKSRNPSISPTELFVAEPIEAINNNSKLPLITEIKVSKLPQRHLAASLHHSFTSNNAPKRLATHAEFNIDT